MPSQNKFPRFALVLILLISLCASLFAPQVESVEAKPVEAADSLSIVISEFRFVGPAGANDEFIELYNPTNDPINITGWRIMGSNSSGATTLRATLGSVTLQSGQYYLLVNSNASAPLVSLANALYSTNFTEDGGVALTLADTTTIIDEVGLSSGSAYQEGIILSPLSGSSNQSYERKLGANIGNCNDTDNNSSDFVWNQNTSNPQNLATVPLQCIVITNVTSSTLDGIYTAGDVIDILITFNNMVNVAGSPTLLLETGSTDRPATYLSGSGSNTLTFRYTIVAGDSSLDLDYVSANALILNGGSITGAIGDAVLILPKPNDSGFTSLADNKDIEIDSTGNPSILSITRQNPTSNPTNANSITFRVTFSEAVINVDINDFVATGTTDMPTSINSISGNIYDVTVFGIDITNLPTGIVGLDINGTSDILDVNSNPLVVSEPTIDETFSIDNLSPNVTLNQASTQLDPANSQPVNFTVAFSEPINVSTFTVSDISTAGSTANNIFLVINNSGDNQTFTVSATAFDNNGTIILSLPAGRVADIAGNLNNLYASTDNQVLLDDTIPPSVTINQSVSQPDPASTLPINFTIAFSEPINTSVFTTSDITQTGTATGVTWSIVNLGDNQNFTLSVTATSGFGTIIPSVAANRVTDPAGNNNVASTSTDNSITYVLIPTSTPTRTPTSTVVRSVIINEIAWAGTIDGLPDDEWIELYNPTNTAINITGWKLVADDGTPNISLVGTIPAGGYFLLERGATLTDNTTVSDIAADQIYTGNALSNSGEDLTLYDASDRLIDTANGNGGAWPRGSSTTFGTMERILNTADSDSAWTTNTGIKRNGLNANGGNILGTPKQSNTVGPTPTPTSNRTSTPTRAATFVIDPRPIINEILPRPGFDWNQDGDVNVYDEFIEIKNLSPIDITLNGWRLDKGIGSTSFVLNDISLSPNERIVFYSSDTNLLLSDGGETVRLINPSGKIYDAYTYTVAKAEDKSICRLPDGNVYGGWFDDCLPTPNLSNTREGNVPTSPDGNESAVCDLPDTIPADFFFAECRGYGANIWNPLYWNALYKIFIQDNTTKWESFIE